MIDAKIYAVRANYDAYYNWWFLENLLIGANGEPVWKRRRPQLGMGVPPRAEVERDKTEAKQLARKLTRELGHNFDIAALGENGQNSTMLKLSKAYFASRRREAIERVRRVLPVSERRTCRVLGQHRSTQRHRPKGDVDEQRLTADIVARAKDYGRYGYRRIHALLGHAGWQVRLSVVERIWRREGLKVPKRQPKRRRLWLGDGSCIRMRPQHRGHATMTLSKPSATPAPAHQSQRRTTNVAASAPFWSRWWLAIATAGIGVLATGASFSSALSAVTTGGDRRMWCFSC